MPPKPKKDKAKDKAEKPKSAQEVYLEKLGTLPLEGLQAEVSELTQNLHELRKVRNSYQIERDQIHQLYDVVRKDTTDLEARIRNIETEMEHMKERHKYTVRTNYLSHAGNLVYTHERKVEDVVKGAQEERNSAEQEHLKEKAALNSRKVQLKEELRAQEQQYEEAIKAQREEEARTLQQLRQDFESNHRELESKLQARLEQLSADLELQRKMEMHEIEERKNRHINELMQNHEKAYNEMRNYYNSITRENLEMIQSLKEQLDDLKAKTTDNERVLTEINKKIDGLKEPRSNVDKKVADKEQALHNYQKDKVSLEFTTKQLAVMKEQYGVLTQKHLALGEAFRKVDAEKQELYKTFEQTVIRVRRRADVRNDMLEQKLLQASSVHETKKEEIAHLLKEHNLDPVVVSAVTSELEQLMHSKNKQTEEMEHEAARVQKAHNDLVHIYESRLKALSVPGGVRGELGTTSTAPADLFL